MILSEGKGGEGGFGVQGPGGRGVSCFAGMTQYPGFHAPDT